MEVDYISINKAFSKQAPNFDGEDLSNPILQWMRGEVRRNIEGIIKPGDKILELNAGTGLDAVYLAQKGFRVHATDLSDGMITAIKEKISHYNLPSCLSTQQLSYTELNKVGWGTLRFYLFKFWRFKLCSRFKGSKQKRKADFETQWGNNHGHYATGLSLGNWLCIKRKFSAGF